MMFDEGISKTGEILDLGVHRGIVNKAGSWYEYEGEKMGQGREAAKEFLKANKKTASKIEKAIRIIG